MALELFSAFDCQGFRKMGLYESGQDPAGDRVASFTSVLKIYDVDNVASAGILELINFSVKKLFSLLTLATFLALSVSPPLPQAASSPRSCWSLVCPTVFSPEMDWFVSAVLE